MRDSVEAGTYSAVVKEAVEDGAVVADVEARQLLEVLPHAVRRHLAQKVDVVVRVKACHVSR